MYTQSSSSGGLTVVDPINMSKPIAESCSVLFAAGLHAAGVSGVSVVEHRWGSEAEGQLVKPFDVIVACGE
jgi:hypothetical protein